MPDALQEVLGAALVGGGMYAALLARVRRRDRYRATPAWVTTLRRYAPRPARWGVPSASADLASRETNV